MRARSGGGTGEMTLRRMIALFVGALVVMLAVVVLRAETTRVHYEISKLDQRSDALRLELLWERSALQRARNPANLLERVKDMRLMETEGEARPPRPSTNRP